MRAAELHVERLVKIEVGAFDVYSYTPTPPRSDDVVVVMEAESRNMHTLVGVTRREVALTHNHAETLALLTRAAHRAAELLVEALVDQAVALAPPLGGR